MNSILQTEKECYICGSTLNLHDHHCFGAANRRWSEKFGLKVWLCADCHNMSDRGVHYKKETRIKLQQIAQRKFEETHTRADFMRIFGRNYL